ARSSAPGTTSRTIASPRRSKSGYRNEKPRFRAARLCAVLKLRSRQRKRRDVPRFGKRDLDHLQFRIELIELRHGRVRLRVCFARAFFNPLFAIVDPHDAVLSRVLNSRGLPKSGFSKSLFLSDLYG